MSKDSGSQVQTTTSEPPSYLRPYLQNAAERSNVLYNQGGTPVTPFAPESLEAMQLASERARAGSPTVNAANQYATQTLRGDFMGGNPWLDQVYNRAAGNVVNTVQSNFGRAGRNVQGVDAAGVASGRLNDLAASLYGGDYQAERQRQNQLTALAPGLAEQDYRDIGLLSGVGSQREDLQRERAEQPARNLDQYIARLQGFPGGTVTQRVPTERNVLAGAAGGAGLGAAFGPWGMLGGAVLGGLLG